MPSSHCPTPDPFNVRSRVEYPQFLPSVLPRTLQISHEYLLISENRFCCCGECVSGRPHITPERFYPGNLLFWPIPRNPRPASPLCGDARGRRQSSHFAVRAAPSVGLGRYVEVTRSRGFEVSTPLVELSKSLFLAGHPRPLRRSRRFTVIVLLLSASRRCRVFRRSLLRPRRPAASCVATAPSPSWWMA